jgi:Tfp pilus assembly protein PilX
MSLRSQARGTALLVALVLMGLITLMAASVVRFSMSGLRVAVNEELRSDAFQNAQSLVDAALAVPQNLNVETGLDETNCVTGVTGCNYNTLVLRDNAGAAVTASALAASGSAIRTRRVGPEISTPPRNTGYSAVRFQAAFLQVESLYDGSDGGWGRATLNEGVTVIVPMLGN